MPLQLTREQVLARSHELPVFPAVISRVLAALDDPDANLNQLVDEIERDPVIAGRVISLANRASFIREGQAEVADVFTAISLVGLTRVRETAIISSLAAFMADLTGVDHSAYFWKHSAAVGVCSLELASRSSLALSVDAALISGLLHDVGQLWLHRFEATALQQCQQAADLHGLAIDVSERECFGVDHGTIGAWLGADWGLPEPILQAIAHHHAPDTMPGEPLVAVVHVAEVLSHALNLADSAHSRVTEISAQSCALLGLDWGDESQTLFGCLEARSHYVASVFH
jgi:putative nucleotidyltransferase with HDIG domain